VPSGKAYGALGAYPSIPPYSALVFEIELVDFYE
jgi:FKBP-type peptidyl-prolyl cis-trans isomerase